MLATVCSAVRSVFFASEITQPMGTQNENPAHTSGRGASIKKALHGIGHCQLSSFASWQRIKRNFLVANRNAGTHLRPVVPFTSKEGARLFSGLRDGETDYAAISSFAPQQHPNFCGVACAVSVLAVSQKKGHTVGITPETFQDHEKLFTPAVEEIRTLSQVKGLVNGDYPGLAIEDMSKILSIYLNNVNLHYAADFNPKFFVDILKRYFLTGRTIVVGFDGKTLGLNLSGHFSTVGAINFNESMVLLLDPAQHKHGWHWVKIDDLLKAMQIPRVNYYNKSRGFLII